MIPLTKPPEPEKYKFSPTGFKKHTLLDNAVVLIIDNPDHNDVVYTHDYFDLKYIWTNLFTGLVLDRTLSKLHGREAVYVDYDLKKSGIRGLQPQIDGLAQVMNLMMSNISEGMTGDHLEVHTDDYGKIVWIEDQSVYGAG